MKNIKCNPRAIATLLVVLVALSASSVFAGNDPKDLLMSFNEYLTSNTTLDGGITLTGAFSERGTRHEDFSVVSANKDGSEVVVSGTSTITTPSGTITTKWTGTIHFNNSTFNNTLLAYIEGHESITGGTGAYAGARSDDGAFEATLDYTNGNVVGVFETKARLK
jgi:hypothetical protein